MIMTKHTRPEKGQEYPITLDETSTLNRMRRIFRSEVTIDCIEQSLGHLLDQVNRKLSAGPRAYMRDFLAISAHGFDDDREQKK